jgi:leucyl aminopeptidase
MRRLKLKAGATLSVALPTQRPLRTVLGLVGDEADTFQILTLAGKMAREIVTTRPQRLGIWTPDLAQVSNPSHADAVLAAILANTETRPSAKRNPGPQLRPTHIDIAGPVSIDWTLALERGAHLTRWLTQLPPNLLNPGSYQKALRTLATRHGWKMTVYTEPMLKRLGAGAFLAVTQGSARRDAALVRLQYRPVKRRGKATGAPLALVGKALCFDTGGLNLKTAKSMLGMHGDMGGSAVAVGTLAALTEARFDQPVDAWLALAENRIGPNSYTQQDVVTAANGVSIQVMHTDAEGRMVLADTLALVSRTKPACIIDFATLTGACVVALGDRLAGAFTNRLALRDLIEGAGRRSGERVWTLPQPADYDDDLESPVADLLQCLIDGKADHIYATRFLSHFVAADIPWIHVDLSTAERVGGLAHVGNTCTGFGVRFASYLATDAAFQDAVQNTRNVA